MIGNDRDQEISAPNRHTRTGGYPVPSGSRLEAWLNQSQDGMRRGMGKFVDDWVGSSSNWRGVGCVRVGTPVWRGRV